MLASFFLRWASEEYALRSVELAYRLRKGSPWRNTLNGHRNGPRPLPRTARSAGHRGRADSCYPEERTDRYPPEERSDEGSAHDRTDESRPLAPFRMT